jgi:hypothetical protein
VRNIPIAPSVVGSGCSGMEVAYDLAAGGAGLVRLSVRTPPSIVLRSMGGLPGDLPAMLLLRLPPRVGDSQVRFLQRLVLGDLAAHGLPVPTEGAFTRLGRLGVAPTVVDRQVVQAIRDRRIQVVSGLQALGTTGATLADGTRVEPDVVVAATGYRRGLEAMVGHLGVLDERGTPRAVGGRAPAPGLRFVGFVPRPGQLHHMGVEADGPPVPSPASCAGRRRPGSRPKSIASGRHGPRPTLTMRHDMGGGCEEQDADGHGPWPGGARPGWWTRAGRSRAAERGLRSADRTCRPARAGSRATPFRSAAVRAGRRPPRQRRRDGGRAAAGARGQADPASSSPFPKATPTPSSPTRPAVDPGRESRPRRR